MTCPNMGCCQGEGSRKGHMVSRQYNYKVRYEKWALPGTSRRCATYLTKFTPELASLSEPLRFLTRKNTIFEWTQQHTRAFERIKQTLTKEQELAHFDPEKETVIQTDASIKGLGACLLQEGKPVYYASRAIGEAEKNYVAIELKSLAVAWALEKLHHFIYGKKFKLQMDQKLLATILSRSRNASTPRLQ